MKRLVLIFILSAISFSFADKKLTWVAIGDSITYLNEHPDETSNRITKGYMTRVVEKLPGIHYINEGHNGWTSGAFAKNIDNLNIQKADVYTIFLGTNDWWSSRPIGNFRDYKDNTGNNTIYGSFRIIMNKVRELNQNAVIILITPMQRTDFVYINSMKNNAYGSYKSKDGQSLEQVAEAVVTIGRFEHIKVIDLYHERKMQIKHLVNYKRLKEPNTGQYKNYEYPNYIDIPFNPDTDEYPYPLGAGNITYDGLHPTDKGFDIIAERLLKVFRKIAG